MPNATNNEHLVLYSGTFDPITLGHLDVLKRARKMFDRIILAIGENPDKVPLFSPQERIDMAQILIDEIIASGPNDAPVEVEHYSGLTVDFALQTNASAILRGIRNISDLAAECQLAITNRVLGIETVFIVTGETFAFTSSSLIKQVAALGGSLDRLDAFVPPLVIERLREKRDDPSNPLGRLARDQLVE